jgi:hypothetical protein
MNWIKFLPSCVRCKVQPTVLSAKINYEGQIQFELLCGGCLNTSTLAFNFSTLQTFAKNQNFQNFIKWSMLPYASTEEKLADDAFLRSMNIDPSPKLLKGGK